MEIFQAMSLVEGSPATYRAIRAWEVSLMIQMQVTEEEYALIPLKERARKVCAMQLTDWIKTLESHRQYEEMKARHGK